MMFTTKYIVNVALKQKMVLSIAPGVLHTETVNINLNMQQREIIILDLPKPIKKIQKKYVNTWELSEKDMLIRVT